MGKKAKIKEIFTSIQGEGPYIGYKQIFIRFCNCNLNCDYCDTDFSFEKEAKEYSVEELKNIVENIGLKDIHSISLTGGEPLLWSEFLNEFIPQVNAHFYLETNATMAKEIEKIKPILNKIEYIAADIKLPSTTGLTNSFALHSNFFEAIKKAKLDCVIKQPYCDKNIFAKIVFDENITQEEIDNSVILAKQHKLELILQPKMNEKKLSVSSSFMLNVLNRFLEKYPKVRLIPQTHKFLALE